MIEAAGGGGIKGKWGRASKTRLPTAACSHVSLVPRCGTLSVTTAGVGFCRGVPRYSGQKARSVHEVVTVPTCLATTMSPGLDKYSQFVLSPRIS